jgi:ketosteroid isomerase-like protein
MSKGLIAKLFDGVDSSDWNILADVFHPDVVYERPGYPPFRGIDRVVYYYQHERVLAAGKHYLEEIVADERTGACCGRFVGMKKDGSEVDERFADVYVFSDGRILSRKSYFFRPAVF